MYITANTDGLDPTKVLTLRRDGLNYNAKSVGGTTLTITENEYYWFMTFAGNCIEVDSNLAINMSRVSAFLGDSAFMEDGEEIVLGNTLMNSLKFNMSSTILDDEIDFMLNLDPPYDPMNYRKL